MDSNNASLSSRRQEHRWLQIEEFLSNHPYILNSDVRQICEVSTATAHRILIGAVEEGKLQKCRIGRCWGYKAVCTGSFSEV